MSSSGDGDKPAQTGLVDMGDISFYNNPPPTRPSTSPTLRNLPGSFSEMVLNVTWAQLQPAEGGPLTTSAIDSAIAAVNAYNAPHGTDVGIKLRVWGGYTAPEWAKNIDGAADHDHRPGHGRSERLHPPDDRPLLDRRLRRRLDEPPERARRASTTAIPSSAAFPRPRAPPPPTNPSCPCRPTRRSAGPARDGEPDRPAAGRRLHRRRRDADAARGDRRLFAMVDDAARLHHEHASTSSTAATRLHDANFTLAVLQQARNSSRLVQPGNHALRQPALRPRRLRLRPDRRRTPRSIRRRAPASFQTASPSHPCRPYANWQATIANGVASNAGDIELWDFPAARRRSASPAFAASPGAGARRDPCRRQSAADDGRAGRRLGAGLHRPGVRHGRRRHASPSRAPMRCFSRAPTPQASFYGVTLTSMNGGTLGVANFNGIVVGSTSGPALTFVGLARRR